MLQVRELLNKITPENFTKISEELLRCKLSSKVILRGLIFLIFQKALDEPNYCPMYAQLCKLLSERAPNFEPSHSPCTFRLLLLNKCHHAFQKRTLEGTDKDSSSILEDCISFTPPATIVEENFTIDEEEKKTMAKCKMIGNMKFLGELGKLEILSESILHQCIQELLPRKSGKHSVEDIECLCQIMRTCGRILDHDKGRALMKQYFDRMNVFLEDNELPQRIRFMIQDVIELRSKNWIMHTAIINETPKTISQINDEDIVSRAGQYLPLTSSGRRKKGDGKLASASDMFRRSLKIRDDIISGCTSPFSPILEGSYRSKKKNNNHSNKSAVTSSATLTNAFLKKHQRMSSNKNSANGDGNNINSEGYAFSRVFPSDNNNTNGNNNLSSTQYFQNYPNSRNGRESPQSPRLMERKFQNVRKADNVSLRPSANSIVGKCHTFKPMMGNVQGAGFAKKMGSREMSIAKLVFESEKNLKNTCNEKAKGFEKKEKPFPLEEAKCKLVEKFMAYCDDSCTNDFLDSFTALQVPDRYVSDLMCSLLNHACGIGSNDKAINSTFDVMVEMKKRGVIRSTTPFVDSFKFLLNKYCEDVPNALSLSHNKDLSCYAAKLIGENACLFSDMAEMCENGAHYPLIFSILQNLKETYGTEKTLDIFKRSKTRLVNMLEEPNKDDNVLREILEMYDLSYLLPLLRVKSDFHAKLKENQDPDTLLKWIASCVDDADYNKPDFIVSLVNPLITFITQQCSTNSNGNIDTVHECADKPLIDKEKYLIEKLFKPIVANFLLKRPYLQIDVLYAIQVYCHSLDFPKGMLLRWFLYIYGMEIVEEDTFLKWREDVNDNYAGKGEALFQVNSWLTWLSQQESDEEEI